MELDDSELDSKLLIRFAASRDDAAFRSLVARSMVKKRTRGYWMASDPEGAKAFLQQPSIDVNEMERLEKEGFYRHP